jgi:hypothetical protein
MPLAPTSEQGTATASRFNREETSITRSAVVRLQGNLETLDEVLSSEWLR